jgi:hypothetical protein
MYSLEWYSLQSNKVTEGGVEKKYKRQNGSKNNIKV